MNRALGQLRANELTPIHRRKNLRHDVIGDTTSLRDAFGFVECPVDTEINSALAIFFFSL